VRNGRGDAGIASRRAAQVGDSITKAPKLPGMRSAAPGHCAPVPVISLAAVLQLRRSVRRQELFSCKTCISNAFAQSGTASWMRYIEIGFARFVHDP
jgi:hypothetical protein